MLDLPNTMISVNIVPLIKYKNGAYIMYEENVYPSADGMGEDEFYLNVPQFQVELPTENKKIDIEELAKTAIKTFISIVSKANIKKGTKGEESNALIKFEQAKPHACIVYNNIIYCYCEFNLDFTSTENKPIELNTINKYKVLYFENANIFSIKTYSIYDYNTDVSKEFINNNYMDIVDAHEMIIFNNDASTFENSSRILDMLETKMKSIDSSYTNKVEHKQKPKRIKQVEKTAEKTTKKSQKQETESDTKSISDTKSVSSDASAKPKRGRKKTKAETSPEPEEKDNDEETKPSSSTLVDDL